MLIDTHVHLDFDAYDADRPAVVDEAARAGVTRWINPSTDLDAADRALALARTYPGRGFVAVGVHPMAADGDIDAMIAGIEARLDDPAVVAIGEAGIDLFHRYHPLERQQAFFTAQAELARARGLPLIVHCRDAYAETQATLERAGMLGSLTVMHCFSGGPDEAAPYIEAGCTLGFTGNLTYPKSDAIRAAAAAAPADRIVVETDGPFLSPQGHRGTRNESRHVAAIAARVAEVRGVSFAEIAEQTTANAERLFALPSA